MFDYSLFDNTCYHCSFWYSLIFIIINLAVSSLVQFSKTDMRNDTYITLSLLLALTSCEGCKEDAPKPKTELEKLPPATQEGKNTFGCLVNGKAWVTETSIDCGAVYQLGILQIYSKFFNPTRRVSLILTENGTAITTQDYSVLNFPRAYAEATAVCLYEPSNTFAGKLSITKIDRSNYIISGLFEFSTAINRCDTLKITNGRFDIKYIP